MARIKKNIVLFKEVNKSIMIDKTIKRIDFLHRYGGFNMKSNMASTSKLKYRLIYINNFLWLNFDLAGGIYWFIDGVITGKDFLGLTYIAPCITLSTLATIKGLFLVLNEGNVLKLMDNLRALEERENKRPPSTEKDNIVNEERNFLHRVINLCTVLYALVVVLFTFSPLIIMTFSYYNNGVVELILPFLILYPFDPFKTLVWPFVYLHQIWSECIVCLDICSADYLFFICCTYLRIQFKLLQHNIENIIPVQAANRRFRDDDEFKEKFRDIIKWHQDLFKSVEILETIYSISTLLNFVSSSMTICLTGFNVAMLQDNTPFVLIFMSFLSMSLFQIFFLCFFADLLMTSSLDIQDAIYKSHWYMAEPRVGKKLLLMQIRAEKPCRLTASGYADVNLNSFMRVLSTAWSYFALLQTIYGGSK